VLRQLADLRFKLSYAEEFLREAKKENRRDHSERAGAMIEELRAEMRAHCARPGFESRANYTVDQFNSNQ